MPKRDVLAREALATQAISTPADLAQWARKRGLASVHILFIPGSVLPSCWQVIWPGRRTDVTGPAWQRGNKTFPARSQPEKAYAERAARLWATTQYGVSAWVRIEGLGNALFPAAVAEELRRYVPSLIVTRERQHARKR